jgi:hypothetical protein
MVIRLGTGGHIVTSWKIVLHVQHGNKTPMSLCKLQVILASTIVAPEL